MGTHPIFESDFDCLTDYDEFRWPFSRCSSENFQTHIFISKKKMKLILLSLCTALNAIDSRIKEFETEIEEAKTYLTKDIELSSNATEWQRKLVNLFSPDQLKISFRNELIREYGSEAKDIYKDLVKTNRVPKYPGELFVQNMDWLHGLITNMTRQNYMKRLEDLENVVLLTPHRFPILDDFVGCYVIVNFNSYNLDEMLPTYKLILNLSNSLMEKCIIGAVDVTFPPNWNLVGQLVGEETPSMLLKRSGTKISYIGFNEKKWVQKLLP